MIQPLKIKRKTDNDAKIAQIVRENIPATEYMSADEVNAIVGKINEMVPAINVSNGGFQGPLSINEKRVDSGFYIPTESGTYINAGDVVVDLSHGINFVTYDGDKWEVAIVPIVADGQIEEGNMGFVSGGEVFSKVVEKRVFDEVVKVNERLSFTLLVGCPEPELTSGWNNSYNWLSAEVKNAKENEEYFISGYSPFSSSEWLNEGRICYQMPDNTFITTSSTSGQLEVKTKAPFGFKKMFVIVAAGKDVSRDIENSPFINTLKISTTDVEEGVIGEKIIGVIQTDQMRNIETRLGQVKSLFYSGNGAPVSLLGLDGDKYLDITNNITYTKKGYFWITDFFSFEIPHKTKAPKIFTETDVSVYRLRNGKHLPKIEGQFITDITSLCSSFIDFNDSVYVDINNGSDVNNGTYDLPFKTLSAALDSTSETIIIRKGFYHREESGGSNFNVTKKNLSIICEEDVFLTSADRATKYKWEELSTNLWTTKRTSCHAVIDSNQWVNRKIGFFHFKEVTSLEDCRITSNTFYSDGENIYLNTKQQPAENIKLLLRMDVLQFFLSDTCKNFYIENARIYNQNPSASLSVKSGTKQSHTNVYIKNCDAYLNRLGNGIAIDNLISVFTQNSGAYGVSRDALNYHTSKLAQGFKKMNVVEYNGWSYDTGLYSPKEYSSNGSTAHEGMSIYRFGGNFEFSRGSTIVDVNDGILSVNCDVTAIGSYLTTTASFQVQDGKMWLFNCNAFESSNALKADGDLNTPTIYYDKDCFIDGKTIGNNELLV